MSAAKEAAEKDYVLIPLTRGLFTKVDANRADDVNRFKWHAVSRNVRRDGSRVYYASRRNGKQTSFPLHRYLIDAPPHLLVDHINGDGLDNRMVNLRLCTKIQNARNVHAAPCGRSGLRGVSWNEKSKKWLVQIRKDGMSTQKFIGFFDDPKEAHRVYIEEAKKRDGCFQPVEKE